MPEIYDFEQRVPFLKLEEVSDGDIVVFDSEGRMVDDKWGSNKLQMDIILPNKEVRRITVNKTSQGYLIAAYGRNTVEWVNKAAVVKKERILVGGRAQTALVLSPQCI